MKRMSVALCSLLTITVLCASAAAQRGGGPRMDPAEQAAAWKLEAGGVAHGLELDGAATAKLAEAYATARASQREGMAEIRSTGERGPGMFQVMQELNAKESGKLGKALGEFLSDGQVTKALAPLGTFNNQWDRMASAIAGFELPEDKLQLALSLIQTYVVDSDKARQEAIAAMDFQSMRAANEELKARLDEGLKLLLPQEDLATWTEATAFRRRGGRGGGGGGRQGR